MKALTLYTTDWQQHKDGCERQEHLQCQADQRQKLIKKWPRADVS